LVKTQPILAAEQLTVGYLKAADKLTVLQKIDLKANLGELHCLVGENGIGKSTLLRTLAGLQNPISGKILIDNKDINTRTSGQLARSIAVVLTKQAIQASFTVRELVAMGRYPYTGWNGRLKADDEAKVDEALSLCQLLPIADNNIHKISDGQLQKTLIARALAQDCPVMILDEPTVHLDPNNRFTIISLLKKIATEAHKCIILSTHQVEIVVALADYIWLAKSKTEMLIDKPEAMLKNKLLHQVFPNIRF